MLAVHLLSATLISQASPVIPDDPLSLDYAALAYEDMPSQLRGVAAGIVETCNSPGWAVELGIEDCLQAQVVHAHFELAAQHETSKVFKESHRKVQAALDAAQAQYERRQETTAELGRLAHADQNDRYIMMEITSGGSPIWPSIRERVEGTEADLGARDEARLETLRSLLPEEGWFTESEHGAQASQGAWLLVQHADSDPEFQEMILERIQPLIESGDVRASGVALLTDRVRVNTDRLQLYGSQGRCLGNAWSPLPIRNPADVNARRKDMDLSSLNEYADRMAEYCSGEDDTDEGADANSTPPSLTPEQQAEVKTAMEKMAAAQASIQRTSQLGAPSAGWSLWNSALEEAIADAGLTEMRTGLARTVARFRFYPQTQKAADRLETAIADGDWPVTPSSQAGVNVHDDAIARRAGRPGLMRVAAERLTPSGPFPASNIAQMIDAAAYYEGEPQTYGTVGECQGREWTPYEISDPDELAGRREALNLPGYETWRASRDEQCAAEATDVKL